MFKLPEEEIPDLNTDIIDFISYQWKEQEINIREDG